MTPDRPVPLTTPHRGPAALPLAGSRLAVWDRARLGDRIVPAGEVNATLRARLTAQRPDLCDLALDRPRIMGILNVTPDSFSDGGLHLGLGAAVARARSLARDADILDIGGESTRPGADTVSVSAEIARTAPVIRALRDAGVTIPISIDTRKAAVAAAALDAGADMVNDVSALRFDPAMAALIAERGVPVCLMHAVAEPKTMQDHAVYADVLAEVHAHLADRIAAAVAAGIAADRIVIDPGIGFGKTAAHNVTLLRGLAAFHDLGPALLVGASRKRFIGALGGADDPQARLPGSLAVALHAAGQGGQVLRVHDAAETRQALRLWAALQEAGDA